MAVPPRILDASWKDSWRVEWPIVLATDFFSAYPLAQQHWGGKNQESIKDQPNMFTFVQFKLSQLEGRRFSNLVKLVFQEWILFEWQISATDGTVHSWHVVDPRLLPYPHHSMVSFKLRTWHFNTFHPVLLHAWVIFISPNCHFTNVFHANSECSILFLEESLISWHWNGRCPKIPKMEGPPEIIRWWIFHDFFYPAIKGYTQLEVGSWPHEYPWIL